MGPEQGFESLDCCWEGAVIGLLVGLAPRNRTWSPQLAWAACGARSATSIAPSAQFRRAFSRGIMGFNSTLPIRSSVANQGDAMDGVQSSVAAGLSSVVNTTISV
jgi:hypothetical protein